MTVVVAPLLLRNIMMFGSPNPYFMGPSTVGFVENLRTYIEALLKDWSACSECARFVAWSLPGLLGFLGLLVVVAFAVHKTFWPNLPTAGKKAFTISTIYLVIGSCVVVAARTRYQWGELINLRHTLQYSAFLLAGLFVLLANHGRARVRGGWKLTKGLIFAFLLLSHINYALFSESFRKSDNDFPKLAQAFATGEAYLCGNQADTYLVSNWAHVFRIECGARVRQIEAITDAADGDEMRALMSASDGYVSLLDAINDVKQQARDRSIRAGFFPGRFGVEPENLPLSLMAAQHLLDQGWRILRNDPQGLILEFPKLGVRQMGFE
jgi:hypothetical protein